MTAATAAEFHQVALVFTKRLAARDYDGAYALTSGAYRNDVTVEQLRADFEEIVPTDWASVGPVEIGTTMTDWPAKQSGDLGWVYLSIGGDVYSEAVTVVVAADSGEARIRDVEFGRP